MPSKPIAERVLALETSSDVTELVRLGVHNLIVKVYSSLEKHLLDDTHSIEPLPPYVERPVLHLCIEGASIWEGVTEPMIIILRASGHGYHDREEEVFVPPLMTGEFMGRTYEAGIQKVEVIDWWLKRLPEQRSTN
jgi:hypothetical protein